MEENNTGSSAFCVPVMACCERLEKELDIMVFPAFHFGAASKAVFALPETKGKTLEEIERHFTGKEKA